MRHVEDDRSLDQVGPPFRQEPGQSTSPVVGQDPGRCATDVLDDGFDVIE